METLKTTNILDFSWLGGNTPNSPSQVWNIKKVIHNLKHSHNAGLSVGEQIHTFNKTLTTALMIKANRYPRALKACEERSSIQDSSS